MARPFQAPWLSKLPDLDGPPLEVVVRLFEPQVIEAEAFFTGYFEPVIRASRTRDAVYATPIYRRPADLVRTEPRENLPGEGTFGRALPDGQIVPHFDRAAIEDGALAGAGLELAFAADPVDAFFAQVQGSARLTFPDGRQTRIGYHGRNGYPYTAIGRVLIDWGVLPEGGATMQTIRAALAADPVLARNVCQQNRSFVFFRERADGDLSLGATAAGGVPLVPFRSLAVDRREIAFGTPLYVETVVPEKGPIAQVMFAEDMGSAILGPARGDIFMGTGDAAGAMAGGMKGSGRLTVFAPRFL